MKNLRALLALTASLATPCAYAGCSAETFVRVTDGAVPDASAASDASDAAAPDALRDAAAGGFCEGLASPPTLCEDFDDGESFSDAEPAAFAWTAFVKPTGTGTLVSDDGESRSAPSSLLARNTLADGGNAQTWLLRAVTPSPDVNGVTLDYDVYIDDIANAVDVKLSALVFNDLSPGGNYILYFATSPTVAYVAERMPLSGDGGVYPYFVSTGQGYPLAKKWTHVAIAIDFMKQPATIKVDLDGQPSIEHQLSTGYLRRPVGMQVGIVFADSVNGPIAVRIDNVVLRVRP